MMVPLLRGLGALALVVAAVSLFIGQSGTSRADEEKKVAGQPGPFGGTLGDYVGFQNACRRCHRPDADDSSASALELITLNEAPVWQKSDFHSVAFTNLKPDDGDVDSLAARMNSAWRLHHRRDTWESAECLVCHAIDTRPGTTLQGKDANEKLNADDRFITKEGVSCEACHGFASGWNQPHYSTEIRLRGKRLTWREVSVQDKELAGQVDLRNPARRAEVCAGCHIGNLQQGKFVTHEMYAIGHPPLPAFELLTYSTYEPAHWLKPEQVRYFELVTKAAEKKKAPLPDFEALYHHRLEEDSDARLFAVGNVTVFRESMKLLADAATAENGSLDFAHFDCDACHHDLRFPSWRQARGYDGLPPGRPPRKQWTNELVDVAIELVAEPTKERAQFESLTKKLNQAMTERVFGNATEVGEQARAARNWANALVKNLQGDLYRANGETPKARDKLLSRLRALMKQPEAKDLGRTVDFNRACQLAWGLQRLNNREPAVKNATIEAFGQGCPPRDLRPLAERKPIASFLCQREAFSRAYDPLEFYKFFGKSNAGALDAKPETKNE